MNSLISAIKAFVLKSRPAYKDYLGNGKYDIKKLPEECVPDSVTLPKDGNPGDILVKTETGSAWEKREQGGGRLVVNGQQVEYGGRRRMMLDKTVSQIHEAYNSGKTVILNQGSAGPGVIPMLTYNSSSFYGIIPATYGSSGISEIAIMIVGNPSKPGIDWTQSDVLWDVAQLTLLVEG